MRVNFCKLCCTLVCFLGTAPSLPAFADPGDPSAVDFVNMLEQVYSVHPGERRNHTKGTCALGSFVGTADAAGYSRSGLFSGASIPVVARFSLAGGDPNAADTDKTPRGMALEFRLPDGSKHHITILSVPVFFAAVPKTFYDQLVAVKPDPATGKPNPDAIKAFVAAHPESVAMIQYLATHNPPPSFANAEFHSLHTFKFINQDNQTTLVRFRFVPEDGEKQLSDDEMKAKGPDFLQQALIDRAKQGPVKWDMLVEIGQPGDPETDSTKTWPADRKEIKAGTLSIISAMPQAGAECEKINYDPLVLSDGVAATDDPVLHFRSPAYAVSFVRRLQGK